MTRRNMTRIAWRALPWFGLPVLAVAVLQGAPDGEPTRLLRSPTVRASQVAFAYANNIRTVPRAGGQARRLTSFQGQTVYARVEAIRSMMTEPPPPTWGQRKGG